MTPSSTIYGYPSKLVIDVLGQEVVVTNWLNDPLGPVEDVGNLNVPAILDAIQVAEKNAHTSTYGGRTDHRAVIGHAPEDRTWKPGTPTFKPYIACTARIEAFVTIDAGLKRATYVGPASWCMKHVHVGHDAMIGRDCELAPARHHLRSRDHRRRRQDRRQRFHPPARRCRLQRPHRCRCRRHEERPAR
jgi:hypothetical protein